MAKNRGNWKNELEPSGSSWGQRSGGPEKTPFLLKLFICLFMGSFWIILGTSDPAKFPFPFEVVQIMCACAAVVGLVFLLSERIFLILAPFMYMLLIVAMMGPFFWFALVGLPDTPLIARLIAGAFVSIPLLACFVEGVKRIGKFICGIDVLAEDKKLQDKSKRDALQTIAQAKEIIPWIEVPKELTDQENKKKGS